MVCLSIIVSQHCLSFTSCIHLFYYVFHRYSGNNYGVEVQVNPGDNFSFLSIIFTFVTILTLYVVAKVMDLVRWCLIWALIAVLLLVVFSGKSLNAISVFGDSCPSSTVNNPSSCTVQQPCLLLEKVEKKTWIFEYISGCQQLF